VGKVMPDGRATLGFVVAAGLHCQLMVELRAVADMMEVSAQPLCLAQGQPVLGPMQFHVVPRGHTVLLSEPGDGARHLFKGEARLELQGALPEESPALQRSIRVAPGALSPTLSFYLPGTEALRCDPELLEVSSLADGYVDLRPRRAVAGEELHLSCAAEGQAGSEEVEVHLRFLGLEL
jgi:hypothetical protein